MTGRNRRSVGGLVVLALAAAGASAASAQVVVGGTAADSSNQPLANVRVYLDNIASVTTDVRGAFRFESVVAGVHVLRFERIGVEPRYLRLAVPAGAQEVLDVGVVVLSVLPTTLEAIRVEAPRYEMNMPGAGRELQQLQRAGLGHMITAEDIDRMNPSTIEDVYRRLPGVLVGGSTVRFVGAGELSQVSCPGGARIIVDGLPRPTVPYFNDPERQIKAVWSYRGALDRCGVIAIETNPSTTGSPGVVGLRLGGTVRGGSLGIERLGVFLSLPVSERFAFYPAAEGRSGTRQGWNVQLAIQYIPVSDPVSVYVGGGVAVGKDDRERVFSRVDTRAGPLLLSGTSVPVGPLRLVMEAQLQDVLDGTWRRVSGFAGLGFNFGS